MKTIKEITIKLSWLLLIGFGLTAGASGQETYGSLVKKGEDLAYDVHYAEAESLFTRAARIAPEKARAYFDVAQIHLWKYLGSYNRDEYRTFMKWFGLAVDKSKAELDSDPADYRASYLLGETYMLRTLAEVTAHSYLDAFWAVRSASGYFKKALKLNPDFYDAYRGLGEIHYFADFIPGSVRWTLGIFGLEANKAKGFAEIRLAYEKGTGDTVKAALSLEQIYSNYVAEYDSAETLMRWLVDRYPRNPMFNYHLAVVLIKERRLPEAERYLDRILNAGDPDFSELNDLSLFLKGDIHFKMNDFENAIKYNAMFLEKAKKTDYTGIANYRMAISYRALGNDAMMKKCLIAAKKGNQNIYDDARSKRRSEEFLRTGISADELLTLEAKNDIEAGKYAEAYSVLTPALDRMRDRETRAEALLVLSEAAIKLGKFKEGTRLAADAASAAPGHEEWIESRSWYLSALGNYDMGNVAGAGTFLKKAKDTDECRSNNILNALVNNLEVKLDGK